MHVSHLTTKSAAADHLTRVLRRLTAIDDRAALIAALVGAAMVIAAAIPSSVILNIWIDEGFTLHSTGSGLGYALREAFDFEAQPPFYFLLEAAWRMLDEGSIAFARLPSTFFSAAGVAVIVCTAHRIAPRIPPLAVAVATAINPLVFWAASEMRVYALVFLIGSALTWAFCAGFLSEQPSRRAQVAYAVTAVIGLYTQYYIGFILVAHGLALLTLRRQAIKHFGLALVCVAVCFLPMVKIALDQVSNSGAFVTHESFLQIAHEVGNSIYIYVLPHKSGWSGATKLAGVSVTTLIVGLITLSHPRLRGVDCRGTIVQWLYSVAIFLAVFLISGVPPLLERHMIVLAPSALIIALLLVDAASRFRVILGTVGLSAVLVFSTATLVTEYKPPTIKPGDWQRVARMLAATPAIPVAVFPSELAVPIDAYRSGQLVSIPRPMEFRANYVFTMALTDEAEVGRVLDPIRARSQNLWLVTTGECGKELPPAPDFGCRFLDAYLHQHYSLIKTTEFRGALARLYTRYLEAPTKTPPDRHAR